MAPLVVVGIAIALVAWAIVRISARIERRRAKRHLIKYGQPDSRAQR
jgi:hypothetical protein